MQIYLIHTLFFLNILMSGCDCINISIINHKVQQQQQQQQVQPRPNFTQRHS